MRLCKTHRFSFILCQKAVHAWKKDCCKQITSVIRSTYSRLVPRPSLAVLKGGLGTRLRSTMPVIQGTSKMKCLLSNPVHVSSVQLSCHDPPQWLRVQTVLGQSLGYASSRMETSERLCVMVCVCVCVCVCVHACVCVCVCACACVCSCVCVCGL